MGWQQITFSLGAADVERAELLLRLAGARSVTLADDADDPVLEPPPGAVQIWPNVRIAALFDTPVDADRLQVLLAREAGIGYFSSVELTEADWSDGLRQTIEAMQFGPRLRLVPADDEASPAGPDVLKLNMGLAFGTGRHPTTRLCLQWLSAADVTGAHVLDYGCGSGILALAALKLGAACAFAIDNDDQALVATAANGTLNGMSERLRLGPPDTLPGTNFDLILANILAGTLCGLAPTFGRLQTAGARIVLSGVLSAQARDVIAAFAPFYGAFECDHLAGWVCIAARRS